MRRLILGVKQKGVCTKATRTYDGRGYYCRQTPGRSSRDVLNELVGTTTKKNGSSTSMKHAGLLADQSPLDELQQSAGKNQSASAVNVPPRLSLVRRARWKASRRTAREGSRACFSPLCLSASLQTTQTKPWSSASSYTPSDRSCRSQHAQVCFRSSVDPRILVVVWAAAKGAAGIGPKLPSRRDQRDKGRVSVSKPILGDTYTRRRRRLISSEWTKRNEIIHQGWSFDWQPIRRPVTPVDCRNVLGRRLLNLDSSILDNRGQTRAQTLAARMGPASQAGINDLALSLPTY